MMISTIRVLFESQVCFTALSLMRIQPPHRRERLSAFALVHQPQR
jgi:hypothetical protein